MAVLNAGGSGSIGAANAQISAPKPSAPGLGQTSQTVTARLEATRLSGPAPLAVQFDASGTTSSLASQHPFHHVRYSFDFGDDQGLTWPISGLPKNSQTGGPLSAHVYDRPGTYRVRVRATDQAGGYSERSVTVEVLDPNAVYSGAATICVSAAGNFSDCPNGATRVTTLPSSASFSGRRVLLRRGETFGSIAIPHGSRNVQVGAFGTGAKPHIGSVTVGSVRPPSAAFPSDITVMDLNILQRFEQYATMSRLLLYRNTFSAPTGSVTVAQVSLASALHYTVQHNTLAANRYFQPRELFVVENQVHGSTANPVVNMVAEGSRFVIMGNDMGTAQQHTVRISAMHKGYLAHNAMRGISADAVRHSLKLHSSGFNAYNDNYAVSGSSWATSQVVVANNLFGDPADNNSWTVAIRPQNPGNESNEGIEDVIVENNQLARGRNTNTDILLVGRRLAARGNVSTTAGRRLNISTDASVTYPLLPQDWRGPYFID